MKLLEYVKTAKRRNHVPCSISNSIFHPHGRDPPLTWAAVWPPREKLLRLESQSRPEGEEKGSVGMCVAMHTPEVPPSRIPVPHPLIMPLALSLTLLCLASCGLTFKVCK